MNVTNSSLIVGTLSLDGTCDNEGDQGNNTCTDNKDREAYSSYSSDSSSLLNKKNQLSQQQLSTIKQIKANETNESSTKHCFSLSPGENYQIRSKDYLTSGLKVNSCKQTFQTRGVDFFKTKGFGPSHIGR
jgi:uncharacterized membrane protein YfhO